MRQKLKTNMYYLEKKLVESRAAIRSQRPKSKSKSVIHSHNLGLISQNSGIESFNMNQDLRLRLEMVQDEKCEIEKKLKTASQRNLKVDETKLKYENLQEINKQLK